MTSRAHTAAEEVEVAIVGAGFSGLGMAIRLRQHGVEDFVVLEREREVGGTWWANTYPGCACDVPSHLYSFSFAPNPEWSHTYSPQPEIGAYLRRVADRFAVRPHIRFGHTVTRAAWDEDAARWRVETSHGTLRARVLVSAAGPLSEPCIPDLPGLDRFEGAGFHSARWDHEFALDGKRVAVIGTGASAIQLVPAIQPRVARLHVFQRTAPWVVPHTTRPISALERRLYRAVPALQRLARGGIYTMREALVLGFVKRPRLMGVVERGARRHLARQVPDPELRARVTPGYRIGCKRILPSNHWYPALGQPNVELVTASVAQVRPHAIVDADGIERPVDAIVLGTGFRVTDMPIADRVRGRSGVTLGDVWQGSPRAYLGTAVAGFPNLFLLLGPNTGLGHGSMVYMIESQVSHVLAALRALRRHGARTVEVRPEAQARFNAALDARMRTTVWSTGCASWYQDATRRNAALWPDWTWRFRRLAARLNLADYALGTAPPARGPAAAASAPSGGMRRAHVTSRGTGQEGSSAASPSSGASRKISADRSGSRRVALRTVSTVRSVTRSTAARRSSSTISCKSSRPPSSCWMCPAARSAFSASVCPFSSSRTSTVGPAQCAVVLTGPRPHARLKMAATSPQRLASCSRGRVLVTVIGADLRRHRLPNRR